MSGKRKLIICIMILLLILSLILKIGVLDNQKFLFFLASQSNEPSIVRYMALERIYKKYERIKYEKYDLNKIKSQNLLNSHIRVSGVIGGKDIIPSLIELYAKYQSNNNYRSTIFFTINSLGMTGDSSLVPLFERLLTNYNNHNIQVPQAVIANALYLLTGRCDYYYIDESKTKHKLNITENQVLARKIILNSRGRRRSFDEMMELEFLFRPPDWRHEMEVFDIFKAKQRRLSNYE